MIRDAGGHAIFVHADVSVPFEVQALLARTEEVYGPVDYAFNNAGIEGATAPTADCTEANRDRVIGVTRTAALEYAGRGIRINAFCPGGIEFPLKERTVFRVDLRDCVSLHRAADGAEPDAISHVMLVAGISIAFPNP